jgi:hypothetical protein
LIPVLIYAIHNHLCYIWSHPSQVQLLCGAALRYRPTSGVDALIIATGGWNIRAYEVAEELSGGTLAYLDVAVRDMATIRHVVMNLDKRSTHSPKPVCGTAICGQEHYSCAAANDSTLESVDSGSARLSEFDLGIVSLRYMAPEAISGSFKNAVGNAAHEACGLKAEKSSLPAMRNSTVRMVLKLAYPRALRLAA